VTQLALDAGGAAGWLGGSSVVAGHGEQSGDQQWRMEQSSSTTEFEVIGEMVLLFIEVVTK
jgi:hypothetical protein